MPDRRHSIEREIFPVLAEQGELNGLAFEGYFIDAGTPEAWCDGVARCIQESRFNTGSIESDSWFSDIEQTKMNSVAIEQSMVCSGVVAEDCQITRTTLLADSKVNSGAKLKNCLIGAGAVIGLNAELQNVVIDHGAMVPDGHLQVGGQWPPAM